MVFCTKQTTPLPPPESQIPRSREIDSFFCIRWLAKCGYLGADPAKFSRSRILQSDKIGRNPMQFSSPDKSNPKRREHGVTNFSLSQKSYEFFAEHRGDRLLPIPANQKCNDYLKEIAAICGIEKRLTFHLADGVVFGNIGI